MDRPGRLRRLRDGWRGLPSGLRQSIVFILILVAFWNLPLFFYRPHCTYMWDSHFDADNRFIGRREMPSWAILTYRGDIEVRGRMTERFAEDASGWLSELGVWNLHVGRNVLIPFHHWLFGSDGLTNANNKHIWFLTLDDKFSGPLSQEVRDMMAHLKNRLGPADDCDIVRALAIEKEGAR